MSKIKFNLFILLGSLLIFYPNTIQAQTAQLIPPPPATCTSSFPLYRFVKPNGTHFYTTNTQEKVEVSKLGFKMEGVAGSVSLAGSNTIALQRYYNSSRGVHRFEASETVNPTLGQFEFAAGYLSQEDLGGGTLYYAVNETTGDTILTSNAAEVAQAGAKGYGRTGGFGYLCSPGSNLPDQIAVYRHWNPVLKAHFYTANADESWRVVEFGYRYEGIAGYLYPSSVQDPNHRLKPIYRLFNPASGKHFYTSSELEKAVLINKNFRFEGTLGKALDGSVSNQGAIMFRYYNSNTDNHLYTTNNSEITAAEAAGYRYEGHIEHWNPQLTY